MLNKVILRKRFFYTFDFYTLQSTYINATKQEKKGGLSPSLSPLPSKQNANWVFSMSVVNFQGKQYL